MRQILYRGYNIQESEWMYGSLLISWKGKCRIIWEEPFGEMPYPDLRECNYEVERDSVGEVLNIHDRERTKICEGDYVMGMKSGVGEIVYDEFLCMFMIQWHDSVFKRIRGREPILENHEISIKVIGNKYENDLEEFLP